MFPINIVGKKGVTCELISKGYLALENKYACIANLDNDYDDKTTEGSFLGQMLLDEGASQTAFEIKALEKTKGGRDIISLPKREVEIKTLGGHVVKGFSVTVPSIYVLNTKIVNLDVYILPLEISSRFGEVSGILGADVLRYFNINKLENKSVFLG